MLATLLCTAPHHHSALDDSPVLTTFPSVGSPSLTSSTHSSPRSSTSVDDRHADSSPGSGPSTPPPPPTTAQGTTPAAATPTPTGNAAQPKKIPSPTRRSPMLKKQRRQFSLSLGGGTLGTTASPSSSPDPSANANASTTSFSVLSLKSTFAFATLRRSGSAASSPRSGSEPRGRWRSRARNASAGAKTKCLVVAEDDGLHAASATAPTAANAKICIGAPSGFRHEFHLGSDDNPCKELWDEARWRQVIEARMGVHVGLHENDKHNETLASTLLHPDSMEKRRIAKSVDFSTLAASTVSTAARTSVATMTRTTMMAMTPTPTPPNTNTTSVPTTTPTQTPTTTPVRPPRNPKRASSNTYTGSVTPEQFAKLGAKLAAMEEAGTGGAQAQTQGVEDALAKLTGTHVRAVSTPASGTTGTVTPTQTPTPKAHKRASLVRRKPVPRLDPEEERALGGLGSSSTSVVPPVPPLPSAPAVMTTLSLMQHQQQQEKEKQRKTALTFLLIPDLPPAPASAPAAAENVARLSMDAGRKSESEEGQTSANGAGSASVQSAATAHPTDAETASEAAATTTKVSESGITNANVNPNPNSNSGSETDASPRPSLSSLASTSSSSSASSRGESSESTSAESEESEAFSTPPMTPTDERAPQDLFGAGDAKAGVQVGAVVVAVAESEPVNQV